MVALLEVLLVQLEEQVELAALLGERFVVVANVADELVELGVLRVDVGALVDAGQETGLPVLRLLYGIAAGAHGDEAGEVLIFRAEAVGDPGAEAGADEAGFAAVHQEE